MKRNTIFSVLAVLATLVLVTTGIVLYAQGYRLDLRKRTLTATGMVLVKSLPDGARVFLNGELTTATNSTVSDLVPGTYHLKLEKNGFFSWEKNVEVKAGLVTSTTTLLPPLSPSLTAVTQEGARLVASAPSGTKAVFITDGKLFLLPLTNQFLGFLRTSPQEIGREPTGFSFAQVTSLLFSPNEDQILVSAPGKSILYIGGQPTPQTVVDPAALQSAWRTETLTQKTETAQRLSVPNGLKEITLAAATVWSPDEKKILYLKTQPDGKREFWVANYTNPLPVGEQSNQKIWETKNPDLRLFWLADSDHFILLENNTVSLLDLDGMNKRDIFKGTLTEAVALSTADLSKAIVLTSFSPNSPANLYAIGLR